MDLTDARGLCPPTTCTLVELTRPQLWEYLRPFGFGAVEMGAATVHGPDGVVVGEVAEETFFNGVSIRLTAVPATADAVPRPFQQTRTPELSTVTVAARHGNWELIASISFSGVVPVPIGQAREWLWSAPLPS